MHLVKKSRDIAVVISFTQVVLVKLALKVNVDIRLVSCSKFVLLHKVDGLWSVEPVHGDFGQSHEVLQEHLRLAASGTREV